MARRPRARQALPPLEALRLVVDARLTDDDARPPLRPSWTALDEDDQRQVVAQALDPHIGLPAWQGWLVGLPGPAPLVGAVHATLLGHAPSAIGARS